MQHIISPAWQHVSAQKLSTAMLYFVMATFAGWKRYSLNNHWFMLACRAETANQQWLHMITVNLSALTVKNSSNRTALSFSDVLN